MTRGQTEPAPCRPERLVLQWHLTERCNLRCTHCYQEEYGGTELPLADLLPIVGRFHDLLDHVREERQAPQITGRITLTGGEPFLHDDLFFLLEAITSRPEEFEFAILTNGTLLDGETVARVAGLGPAYVQVSLEGGRETHDRIRGEGTFDLAIEGMRRLVRSGVRVLLSFTAQRSNFREFPEVAQIGIGLGVARVWSDRLIPHGSGSLDPDRLLGPEDAREFFRIMRRVRSETSLRFCKTEIAMGRALQFLAGGDTPYHCGAGERLITLMPDGTVLPCRRMPIVVGNALETSLREIWRNNELLRKLRDPERIPAGCEGCIHNRACRGGLRCLAYAVDGDPFCADPDCWHARRNIAAAGSRQ